MESGFEFQSPPNAGKEEEPHPMSWRDLAQYIQRQLLAESSVSIDATTPLITSGLLDSFSIVELIAHIEERYKIRIDPRWHRIEHFDSLASAMETIERIRREERSGAI